MSPDPVTYWQLLRFRPGATVRDVYSSYWVKQPDGRWKCTDGAWWTPGRFVNRGSFSLRRRYGPLRRML